MVRSKRSLWTVGIDFNYRSHRPGSDLRWSEQKRLLRLLKLLRSLPGFRPQAKGELEERPGVGGQLRRHFLISHVPGRRRYLRCEHWVLGGRVSQGWDMKREEGSRWTRERESMIWREREEKGRERSEFYLVSALCDAPPQFRIGSMATPCAHHRAGKTGKNNRE